ncbi:uncharacterized protein STEHIDRAFT_159969 [Stereum hirsutum FP-91666 SS1]|uniref:uncharacterized protein n=1 Tax=Stereum hirsutum (strain FP-91666) TaxID=721885 RepID=UPI0004449703|nr:uncharacterized protein STEHIDRAFT_159969 [Stereum hirsutum FP-91666 SS1]EIM83388.1 hypothetical protein STEHIDRAFT_159969 [Stereum hirsutum FP-91666 SS1]
MPRILQTILLNAPFSQRKPFNFDHILYAGFAKSSSRGISHGNFNFSTRAGTKEAKPTTQPHKRAPNGIRVIQTLDQSRLKPSDFQDISGLKSFYLSTTFDNEGLSQKWEMRYTHYTTHGKPPRKFEVPFPEGTHGFLYYRPTNLLSPTRNTQPSDGPAGQVYFRITKDNDPASFASGRDLMQRNGDVPWYIVPKAKTTALWRLLLKDGLVTASTKSTGLIRSPKPHISTFLDPFIIDLSHHNIQVNVRSLRDGNVLRLVCGNPFRGQTGSASSYHQCFTGQYINGFRSTFRRHNLPPHTSSSQVAYAVVSSALPIRITQVPTLS